MDETVPQLPPEEVDEDARLRRAYRLAEQKLLQERQAGAEQRRSEKGVLQKGIDLWKSAGAGIAKAGFETKDFFFGEPTEEEKSELRRGIEQRGRELADESFANSITQSTAQIITGLIGVNKILGPIKAAQKIKQAGKAGRAAYEIAVGATAGSVAIDPHEERLADLIKHHTELQIPVLDYLASDPMDTAAEGRLKNAIESIGLDLGLVLAIKGIKAWRQGRIKDAKAAFDKLEAQQTAKAEAEEAVEEAVSVEKADSGPVERVEGEGGVTAQATAQDAPAASVESNKGKRTKAGKEAKLEQLGTKPQPVDPKTGDAILPTDKAGPKVIKTLEVTDDDLAAILKGADTDRAAIHTYGSVAAAREAGHVFNEVNVPWQKLMVKDAGSLLQSAYRVMEPRISAAKGGKVLPDARVYQMAKEWSHVFNEDPAEFIGDLMQAGKAARESVAMMEAGLRLSNKMLLDLEALNTRIRNGNLEEFGGDYMKALEVQKARTALFVDVLGATLSIRANAGRAVRRNQSRFKVTNAQLKAFKDLDPEKVDLLLQRADGDLTKAVALMKETRMQKLFNAANFHLVNGLLWLWPTHLVNVTGNALMSMMRPTEKYFGLVPLRLKESDPAQKAALSAMARQARLEYVYTVSSMWDAWVQGVKAFRLGDSILAPHQTEYFQKEITGLSTTAIPWKPVNGVWDLAQNLYMAASYRNLIGLPTRSLGALDEAFKQMRYRAIVQARAAVDASEKGLEGQEFKDYVQDALKKAIDPDTGAALDSAALKEAQTTTFQRDLDYEGWVGSTGRALQNYRRSDPKGAFVLPFVKTPVNVLRYGIKLTPGLNLLQKEYLQAISGELGAEAQAHAIGQMMLGSIFAGLVAHMTLEGKFTGAGPSDPELMRELVATGWKPYSYVHTAKDGTKTYYQLGRFDPWGMAFGLIADITNAMQKDPERDYSSLIMASVIALAKGLGERSFLLNLNTAMEAFMEPDEKLPKWLGRTAGSMLPFSSLMRGHNPDPYLREARGFVDNALRGVPGYSETLPVVRDWLGDPVERYVGIYDTQEPDIVESEHNRIMLQTGKGIRKPSPRWASESIDLRDFNLTEGEFAGRNAYEALQELSGYLPGQKPLRQILKEIIESDVYQSLPDGDALTPGTRLHLLAHTVEKYRHRARMYLIAKSPELQAQIGHKKREARDARLKALRAEREANEPKSFQDMLSLPQ